jgi:alkaline phosphatase D
VRKEIPRDHGAAPASISRQQRDSPARRVITGPEVSLHRRDGFLYSPIKEQLVHEADAVAGTVIPSPAAVSRRRFLRASAVCGSLLAVGSPIVACSRPAGKHFTLGVASGDPLPDGVVLWTRLAPYPLNGGGMPSQSVGVDWEVAADESFRRVVRRGKALASPAFAHSVHIDVRGLQPASWYWYRFRVGSELSPVGRTRTAPAPHASSRGLTFAFASCQNYEHGLFTSLSSMAKDELDLVVHLGDYIYEAEAHTSGSRAHGPTECLSLRDYRDRYALYKSDPALQAAHAAFPFVVTFDDHEVEDNYAGEEPKAESDTPDPREFLQRRSNAYQAYWEHLPLRRTSLPQGPSMRLFRRLRFGDLLSLNLLDTRQYRSDQPCGDGVKSPCPASLDPMSTMIGQQQEGWLLRGLARSSARWNVIAQQTLFSKLRLDSSAGGRFLMDQWDGYVAARNRLSSFLGQGRARNPVIISGDTHASWVNGVKADFDDPDSPVVAPEFGGPSITSECDPQFVDRVRMALDDNPHIRFFEGTRHGYVRCKVGPERFRADYRVVPSVWSSSAVASTLASFEVEDGFSDPMQVS